MKADLPQLIAQFSRFLPERERYREIGLRVGSACGVIALAYLVASLVSTILMSLMLKGTLTSLQSRSVSTSGTPVATLAMAKSPNYRDIRKAIVERNLFNAEGKVPDEADSDRREGGGAQGVFNINAPCNKPSINIELLGTIYLGESGTSVATIKEAGYPEADIYKVGDGIVGNETAVIAKIERRKVIINNKGVKECLDLGGDKVANAETADGFPVTGDASGGGAPPQSPPAGGGATVVLDAPYVESELGPGFGKIIQSARLVPNTDPTTNQVNGFKIFSIDQSSILGKIGFQNGDVITQVNDVSLKLPEQGFALYQAMQENREITIQLLRGGSTPTTINVRVK